ncbi:MAG TPA: glycosyltransferase [Acidimicrobiales bacterium]|jgi:glycosyltransferase involved in cell wall biosynthesis|nr:glycosyltransferase [Acidimicrobiales bacterium]
MSAFSVQDQQGSTGIVTTEPPLTVVLDQPPGEVWEAIRGYTLSGSVDNVKEPGALQVRVQLAGRPPQDARLGPAEPSPSGSGRASVVWTLDLPAEELRTLPPGTVRVTVLANVGRSSAALRRTFAVHREPLVFGSLDSPSPDDTVQGDVLSVRGWCLFEESHLARVEIVVGGRPAGLARLYTVPPSASPNHMDGPVAGFEALVNVRQSERGETSLVSVEATALDGRRWRSETHRVTWSPRQYDDVQSAGLARSARANTAATRRVPTDRSTVIVCAHDLGYNGGQLWLLDLLRRVVQSIDNRCVVIAPTDGLLRPVLESMQIEVHVTPPFSHTDARSFEGHVHELALLMRSHDGGVLLANTLLAFPAVVAAARADIPSIWAVHESVEPAVFFNHYGEAGAVFASEVREHFEESFRSARALVFEAQRTEALFADLMGATPGLVVDYGVDIGEIDGFRQEVNRDGLRAEHGFGPSDTVALVVSTFEPRKSHGMIVAAFDELAAVHDHLHLLLVGLHPCRQADAVRQQIERCRYRDRIHVEPLTHDIYPWYAMADVLLSASDIESLPRSFMEAMAFDLPIVSTDVFGVSDLIEDSRSGWLTQARDLEGLVGLLHMVLRAPASERAEMASRARTLLCERDGDSQYGAFFASALSDLLRDPEHDLTETWTTWKRTKGGTHA